jgi:hypothetical protein
MGCGSLIVDSGPGLRQVESRKKVLARFRAFFVLS